MVKDRKSHSLHPCCVLTVKVIGWNTLQSADILQNSQRVGKGHNRRISPQDKLGHGAHQICPLQNIVMVALCKSAWYFSDQENTNQACILVLHVVREIMNTKPLNLQTELFRPLWTHQRSTEKMKAKPASNENKFSKARFEYHHSIHARQ